MLKEYIWKAFECTGNIDAYILYKEMEQNGTVASDLVPVEKDVIL